MTLLESLAILPLLGIMTLFSYVDRLYAESGKFLAREFQQNIDIWELQVEPRLGLSRKRIALSAAILKDVSLACLTVCVGAMLFTGTSVADRPGAAGTAQAILGVLLAILLFNQLLPMVLFTRTRGLWIVRLRVILKVLFHVILPATLLLGFLLSIAALAEPPPGKEEDGPGDTGVDALIEAGEEEGIIEESDRDLVRSAVEFGDKVVREVMTPRPDIFAVPGDMTVDQLISRLKDRPYSRIPVFTDVLDRVTGIAFAHDLLHIPDEAAGTRTVGSIQHAVAFVPESKRVNELLREMQREKQHMRVVIDEYGGVAGLVTIEDLLEELVGSIADEHEQGHEQDGPVQEAGGTWLVPGNLEVARLEDLLGAASQIEQRYQATTTAGLVSEIAGRIPLPGEVIVAGAVRFEVVASTGHRIDRLRVSPVESASR